MRKQFRKCPRMFEWSSLHGFTSPQENIHLHAGACWATALETTRLAYWGAKKSPLEAFKAGLEQLVLEFGEFPVPIHGTGANKNLPHLVWAFGYFFGAFPLDKDPAVPHRTRAGTPMVEFSFALPLHPDLRHPVTGEPILFSGRADMIAQYAGALTIFDDKTTSSLGSSWAAQWHRAGQFSGYAWAAREYGLHTPQILIRGISLLKDSIKHAEVLTTRTPHHIEEWHSQFIKDIRSAIQMWENSSWDPDLGDACSSFGACPFLQPCSTLDPAGWLNSNYARRVWNPATRTESRLDPYNPSELSA